MSQRGDMRAMSDEARYEARKHLTEAADALTHGEDDNAQAHILDALMLLGRGDAFLEAAEMLMEEP